MILFAEGFDNTSAADLWDRFLPSYNSWTLATGRFGTGSAIQLSAYDTDFYEFSPPLATLFFNFGFCGVGTPHSIYFKDGATKQVVLTWTINAGVQTLSVYRNITLLGSYVIPGLSELWHHYQVKVTIDSTVGVVEIRMDGIAVPVLNITGANTQTSATPQVTKITFGGGSTLDDCVIQNTTSPNNDFLGEIQVLRLLPTADGYLNEWEPSTGDEFECVNDPTGHNITDYIYSGVVGKISSFALTNLVGAPTIFAVIPEFWAIKDDVSERTMRSFLRSDASNYEHTTRTLTSVYNYFTENPIELDPAEEPAAPWTYTRVNDLEIGVEVMS